MIFTSENRRGDECLTGSCGQSPTENVSGTDHDPPQDLAYDPKYTTRPPLTSRCTPAPPFSFVSHRKIAQNFPKTPPKNGGGVGGSEGDKCKTGTMSDPANNQNSDVNFRDRPFRRRSDCTHPTPPSANLMKIFRQEKRREIISSSYTPA